MNREKEESDASPFPAISTVEEVVSAEVHGGATVSSPKLAGRTREATVSHRKKPRRESERRRACCGPQCSREKFAWSAPWPAAMDLAGTHDPDSRVLQNMRKVDKEREKETASSPAQ